MMTNQERQSQGDNDVLFFVVLSWTIVCFSFEEEQQELQKSLSKDWCDKMDNEEAEEKKLHR